MSYHKRRGTAVGLWTDRDIAFLRDYYITNGARWVAHRLHRTEIAVMQKARLLGIIRRGKLREGKQHGATNKS